MQFVADVHLKDRRLDGDLRQRHIHGLDDFLDLPELGKGRSDQKRAVAVIGAEGDFRSAAGAFGPVLGACGLPVLALPGIRPGKAGRRHGDAAFAIVAWRWHPGWVGPVDGRGNDVGQFPIRHRARRIGPHRHGIDQAVQLPRKLCRVQIAKLDHPHLGRIAVFHVKLARDGFQFGNQAGLRSHDEDAGDRFNRDKHQFIGAAFIKRGQPVGHHFGRRPAQGDDGQMAKLVVAHHHVDKALDRVELARIAIDHDAVAFIHKLDAGARGQDRIDDVGQIVGCLAPQAHDRGFLILGGRGRADACQGLHLVRATDMVDPVEILHQIAVPGEDVGQRLQHLLLGEPFFRTEGDRAFDPLAEVVVHAKDAAENALHHRFQRFVGEFKLDRRIVQRALPFAADDPLRGDRLDHHVAAAHFGVEGAPVGLHVAGLAVGTAGIEIAGRIARGIRRKPGIGIAGKIGRAQIFAREEIDLLRFRRGGDQFRARRGITHHDQRLARRVDLRAIGAGHEGGQGKGDQRHAEGIAQQGQTSFPGLHRMHPFVVILGHSRPRPIPSPAFAPQADRSCARTRVSWSAVQP